MLKLAVLISGGGSNLQSIIDAIESKELDAKICAVVASNENAYGLVRAAKHNIPVFTARKNDFPSVEERDKNILEILRPYNVDYVVLAGYLSVLTACFVNGYKNKIINIHPALLPKFGGQGMYGINVHKAVIDAKETQSGATVHYVDAGTDTGEIILQESLDILPGETPESLQKRILEQIEHKLLVKTLIEFSKKDRNKKQN